MRRAPFPFFVTVKVALSPTGIVIRASVMVVHLSSSFVFLCRSLPIIAQARILGGILSRRLARRCFHKGFGYTINEKSPCILEFPNFKLLTPYVY